MRLPTTPPQVFALVSLLLIAAMLAATSVTLARFFREAVIEREAVIVRDMAHTLTLRGLSAADLEHYAEAPARMHFEEAFAALKALSGVVRIKLYDRHGTIAWSDEPGLVGKRTTAHERDLHTAIGGTTRAVLNPAQRPSHAQEGLPAEELIEFYIPFSLPRVGTAGEVESAAVAVYRTARELNATIRHGLALLWLVTGAGGVILFLALYGLFRSVYRRQREAEHRFERLSVEHARIVQMEKLSAMGQMVGEIAHQFNNPLVGVINLAQRAEQHAGDPQRVRALLVDIRKAGEHCSAFVQRLLRFTRLAHSEPQPTELRALMSDTIDFLTQSTGAHTPVALTAPEEEVWLRVDPVLLRHALFNLLHNAVQADPHGPVEAVVARHERAGAAGWQILVSDHGPGLPAESGDKLFTPFFTTRPGGTGLGLSVARHIVNLHGGDIRAMANPGGGAQFAVWLPAQASLP